MEDPGPSDRQEGEERRGEDEGDEEHRRELRDERGPERDAEEEPAEKGGAAGGSQGEERDDEEGERRADVGVDVGRVSDETRVESHETGGEKAGRGSGEPSDAEVEGDGEEAEDPGERTTTLGDDHVRGRGVAVEPAEVAVERGRPARQDLAGGEQPERPEGEGTRDLEERRVLGVQPPRAVFQRLRAREEVDRLVERRRVVPLVRPDGRERHGEDAGEKRCLDEQEHPTAAPRAGRRQGGVHSPRSPSWARASFQYAGRIPLSGMAPQQ